MQHAYLKTPVGILHITSSDSEITRIGFVSKQGEDSPNPPQCLRNCMTQLKEYFAGKRRDFDLPLNPDGTAFQKSVWKSLCQIPFGRTRSYSDLSKAVRRPRAQRAVGNANKKNPIAIVIPCHRVIQKSGALGGYASGTGKKEWLLRHEQSAR